VWDVDTFACLEVIEGSGDVLALAREASDGAFRGLVRSLETVVEETTGGEAQAWFPLELRTIVTHPSRRLWAGRGVPENYLALLALAGAAPGARPTAASGPERPEIPPYVIPM
jgi:hypothetical protein